MRAGLLLVGLIFFVVGIFFSLTIIGLIIGIPIGLVGFIIMLVGLFSSGKSKPQNITIQQTVSGKDKNGDRADEDLLKTLKSRYVKGEITSKQYKDMKADLEE
jgi:uncharacterized membrane protein